MPLIVDREVLLIASPLEVFSLISDHRRLPEWAPGLRRVDVDEREAEAPGGKGTIRTLIPRLGAAGQEVVKHLDHARGELVYGATDRSLRRLCRAHEARLDCRPHGTGARLRFRVSAEQGGGAMRFWVARAMFAFAVTASLHNLRRRFGAAPDEPQS